GLAPNRQRPVARALELDELRADLHHALDRKTARVLDRDRGHRVARREPRLERRRQVVATGGNAGDPKLRAAREDAVPHDAEVIPRVEIERPVRLDLEILAGEAILEDGRIPSGSIANAKKHARAGAIVEKRDLVSLGIGTRLEDLHVSVLRSRRRIRRHAKPELEP